MKTAGPLVALHQEAGTPPISPCPVGQVERRPLTLPVKTAGIPPVPHGGATVLWEPYLAREAYSWIAKIAFTKQKDIGLISGILTSPGWTEASPKKRQWSEFQEEHHCLSLIYLEVVKGDPTEEVTLEEEVCPGEVTLEEGVCPVVAGFRQTDVGHNLPIGLRLID